MKATYTVLGLRCGNCGWSQSAFGAERISIPQGVTVTDTPCPKCGCKTLSSRRFA